MTIIQVKYFVAVGDELNFTKAAEKMFVTQQVISKQIKILEEELGFPLLIRDKHKVAFTDGGRLMYQFWVEVLRQHRQVVEKAFDLMNKNDQIIRIGTIEVNRFYDWIVCAIDKVNSNDPSREFRVESVSSRSLYQGLIDTKYDLIISVANENMNLPERFEEIKFKKSNPKLVISSSHPAYRSDLLLMDLKEYPLYIYSSMFSMKAKKQILSHCHKIGIDSAKNFRHRCRFFNCIS